ncbi:MAG: TIGR04211 family SH3 domain-containing protein [Gammaproteobacteria bacterium]|nr:TIGR04211 family SH3 domain-containing protein [Gammaproteobacteria bacterium]MCF6231403.1 TIGR04211 family SH3 domain-containing protein [Gammaproteobacteria bacterium]
MKQLIFTLLLLFFTTGTVAAEVVKYVNDYLLITLRSGPGSQFKIEKNLGSGTQLTILQQSEDGKFSLVRTDKGVEGWVLNQYLVSKPVARQLLGQVQRELATLKEQYQTLQQRHAEVSDKKESITKERAVLSEQLETAHQKLETLEKVAARPLQLESENSRLTNEAVELRNRLRITEEKNRALEDSEARQWFAVGAVVLFLGIILGLIIPRLKPRRSDSWGGI